MNGKIERRDLMDGSSLLTRPVMIINPQEVTLLDMNFTGAGIKTDSLLEVGAKLSFDLFINGLYYTLKAEVIWSKQIGVGFRSGLKILDVPPDFAGQVEMMMHRMIKSRYNN